MMPPVLMWAPMPTTVTRIALMPTTSSNAPSTSMGRQKSCYPITPGRSINCARGGWGRWRCSSPRREPCRSQACPGVPPREGKNERSHQTLTRFLDANPPATLAQARRRIGVFREHYNTRRPHQALGQTTPAQAWNLLEHTPATDPIPLVVLEAKAKTYLNRRRIDARSLYRAHLTVTKDGRVAPSRFGDTDENRDVDEAIVTVTKDNHQVYYQGHQIKLPASYGGQEYYRTISDEEFLLADPDTGEVVFSFPLPLVAMRVKGRFIISYSIRGVYMANPTPHWSRQHAQFHAAYARQELQTPNVFTDE